MNGAKRNESKKINNEENRRFGGRRESERRERTRMEENYGFSEALE